MYEHLSWHGVSPEKLSSPIWLHYFVDQEHWRQPIRTQHSQTKTGIQLMCNITQIHHPVVHTWGVWWTFQMRTAFFCDIMLFSCTLRWKLQVMNFWNAHHIILWGNYDFRPNQVRTSHHKQDCTPSWQWHETYAISMPKPTQLLPMTSYHNVIVYESFPQQTVCLCNHQEIKTNKQGEGGMSQCNDNTLFQ